MGREEDKQKIRRLLKKGKQSAKHADLLAVQASIKDIGRTQEYVRSLIRELITEGLPVGSLPKYGFWIITTEEELREVTRSLKSRKRGIKKRIREIEEAFYRSQD